MKLDKQKIYFLDSNIFLRTLIKEDEKSFRASSHLLQLVQNRQIKAFTSALILAEIGWVLSSFYKFSKSNVLLAIQGIINLKGLKIVDKTNPLLACEIYQKYSVKFVDALIASNPLIAQKKAIIVSYDLDFEKLDLLRLDPDSFLKI